MIRACSVSVTDEIASVFYFVSLDSADVLAIKVYFKNRTVAETDSKRLPEKQAHQRHRVKLTCIFQ